MASAKPKPEARGNNLAPVSGEIQPKLRTVEAVKGRQELGPNGSLEAGAEKIKKIEAQADAAHAAEITKQQQATAILERIGASRRRMEEMEALAKKEKGRWQRAKEKIGGLFGLFKSKTEEKPHIVIDAAKAEKAAEEEAAKKEWREFKANEKELNRKGEIREERAEEEAAKKEWREFKANEKELNRKGEIRERLDDYKQKTELKKFKADEKALAQDALVADRRRKSEIKLAEDMADYGDSKDRPTESLLDMAEQLDKAAPDLTDKKQAGKVPPRIPADALYPSSLLESDEDFTAAMADTADRAIQGAGFNSGDTTKDTADFLEHAPPSNDNEVDMEAIVAEMQGRTLPKKPGSTKLEGLKKYPKNETADYNAVLADMKRDHKAPPPIPEDADIHSSNSLKEWGPDDVDWDEVVADAKNKEPKNEMTLFSESLENVTVAALKKLAAELRDQIEDINKSLENSTDRQFNETQQAKEINLAKKLDLVVSEQNKRNLTRAEMFETPQEKTARLAEQAAEKARKNAAEEQQVDWEGIAEEMQKPLEQEAPPVDDTVDMDAVMRDLKRKPTADEIYEQERELLRQQKASATPSEGADMDAVLADMTRDSKTPPPIPEDAPHRVSNKHIIDEVPRRSKDTIGFSEREHRLFLGFEKMTPEERTQALSDFFQNESPSEAFIRTLVKNKFDSFPVGKFTFQFGKQMDLPNLSGRDRKPIHCMIVGVPEPRPGQRSNEKVTLLNQNTNELFDVTAAQLAQIIDSGSGVEEKKAA